MSEYDPIWEDAQTGIAVYVNGGLVEISSPPTVRIDPEDAGELGLAFVQALVDARRRAKNWDTETRTYVGDAS